MGYAGIGGGNLLFEIQQRLGTFRYRRESPTDTGQYQYYHHETRLVCLFCQFNR
jgi:hypothetical protein